MTQTGPWPESPAAERIRRLAEETAGQVVEESAPGGEVRVVVDLHGALRQIRLDPHAVRRLDRFTLGEMITAGIRRAQAQARDELTAALRGDGTRADR